MTSRLSSVETIGFVTIRSLHAFEGRRSLNININMINIVFRDSRPEYVGQGLDRIRVD